MLRQAQHERSNARSNLFSVHAELSRRVNEMSLQAAMRVCVPPRSTCFVVIMLLNWLWGGIGFAAQEKLVNVTIAYTSISPQYAPVWIAKEAGIFKKNGINAQLVYMRGGIVAT